ncbi:MAG TPA: Stp1/IreP family PP2C-type Ser/Thr phosphatase [Candidatus Angelobacter sp.]|nr:Stp1/IreP family PP2C-type Ser/Thr phosphatase [Candidatus Angelobacter sp.]
MTLAVEVAGKTDVGCVRANNEDNFGYDSRYGIFVVCDGMGGQAAGEVASKMGVDILLEYFRNTAGRKDAAGQEAAGPSQGSSASPTRQPATTANGGPLANAIRLANKRIYEAGERETGKSGMGSTVVAALVRGNSLTIGNVGDSRIYLIRHGEIQQLTRDHSLVMEQVRLGLITREQAEQSEMQNVILRALGSEKEVEADVEDLLAVSGDLLLMSSDGLTRHVRDQEILKIVTAARSLEAACATLIETAKDRGGDDNITCLLLKIVDRPWYKHILHKVFSGGRQWQNSI